MFRRYFSVMCRWIFFTSIEKTFKSKPKESVGDLVILTFVWTFQTKRNYNEQPTHLWLTNTYIRFHHYFRHYFCHHSMVGEWVNTDVLNVVDIGSNSFDRNSHPNYGCYDVFFLNDWCNASTVIIFLVYIVYL